MIKKLKKSADRIVMPEELKKRILEKCDNTAESESEEITFMVEPFRRHTAARFISVAAACAVVIGGLGYSVRYISKEGFSPDSLSDTLSNAPFGDISDKAIDVYSEKHWTMFHAYEIPEDAKKQIAEFLNNMEYTEKENYYYPPESVNPDRPNNAYTISLPDNKSLYIIEDNTLIYSYSLNEDDEICYYIDYNAFDKLINSLLCFSSPFGNIYGNENITVTEYVYNTTRIPTKEQKRELAELFNDHNTWQDWEELPETDFSVPCYTITLDNATISIYKNDALVYESGDTKTAYRINFGDIDKRIRYIMLTPAPFGHLTSSLDVGELYIDNEPVEYNGEALLAIDELFDTIDWIPTDDYDISELTTDYGFVFKDGSGNICISANDRLIYNKSDGTQEVYKISFDSFEHIIENFYPEHAIKELIKKHQERGTLGFSGFRNAIPSGELSEKDSAEILSLLDGMCLKQSVPPITAAGFIPEYDFITFTHAKTSDIYSVNLIYGFVMKTTDSETTFFTFDKNNITALLITLMKDHVSPLPPIQKDDKYYCDSEHYNGVLTEEEKILLNAALCGWDWSDCYNTDEILFEIADVQKYRFISADHEFIVYSDGTVSCDKMLYIDVDGENDNLCQILDEIFVDAGAEDMLASYRQ